MDIQKIDEIRQAYKNGKTHEEIIAEFNLNHAQEYAINIVGRDNKLSDEVIKQKLEKVVDGMTSGQISDIMLS